MAVGSQSIPGAGLDEASPGVVLRFPARAARRRRSPGLVVRRALAAVALGATVVSVLMGSGGGTAQAVHSTAPRAVVVRTGQTVWDIAERYAPPSIDPRAYMDEILQLNHLRTVPAAGVRIRLPR